MLHSSFFREVHFDGKQIVFFWGLINSGSETSNRNNTRTTHPPPFAQVLRGHGAVVNSALFSWDGAAWNKESRVVFENNHDSLVSYKMVDILAGKLREREAFFWICFQNADFKQKADFSWIGDAFLCFSRD